MSDLAEVVAMPACGDPAYVEVGTICLLYAPPIAEPAGLGLVVRVDDDEDEPENLASVVLVSTGLAVATYRDLPLSPDGGVPFECTLHCGLWTSVFYDQIGKAVARVDGRALDEVGRLSLSADLSDGAVSSESEPRVVALVELAQALSSGVLELLLDDDPDQEDEPDVAGFIADVEDFLRREAAAGAAVGLAWYREPERADMQLGPTAVTFEIDAALRQGPLGLGAVLKASVADRSLYLSLEYVAELALARTVVAVVTRPDGGVTNPVHLGPDPVRGASTLVAIIPWSHDQLRRLLDSQFAMAEVITVVLRVEAAGVNTRVTVDGTDIVGESDIACLGWTGTPSGEPAELDESLRPVFSFAMSYLGPHRRRPADEDVRRVGRIVRRLLLPGPVSEHVVKLLQGDPPTRLSLVADLYDPRLAAVPWELVRTDIGGHEVDFADNGLHAISRRARWEGRDLVPADPVNLAPRILLVKGADDGDTPMARGEGDLMRQAIGRAAPGLELCVIDDLDLDLPTLEAQVQRLAPVGVIQVIGHGVRDGSGVKLAGNDVLTSETIDSLARKASVKLVVLSVCEGGLYSETYPVGVASDLVRKHTAAVLAMRTRVLDNDAANFTSRVLALLAEGEALEVAVAEARPAMHTEFASPMLYLPADTFVVAATKRDLMPAPWVQIRAAHTSSKVALVGDAAAVVEPSTEVLAPTRPRLRFATSPDGRAVVWQRGTELRCAWLGEAPGGPRVVAWDEHFEISGLNDPELLAIVRAGDLAVDAVVSTVTATHRIRLKRGKREWIDLGEVASEPSSSAAVIGSRVITTDNVGDIDLDVLKDFETILLADVATWGGQTVVAFTAQRQGRPVVACLELPERRITVLGESTADRVVVERRLQPDSVPWSVLVEQNGAVNPHTIGGQA